MGNLTIARSLTLIDGVATAGDTKTHQRRTIALDDALAAVLAGAGLTRTPTAYNPGTLTDYYKRAAKRLGITTHFHELRHFAATTAIASGADVRTVAGRLGHADASAILRGYAHALEARDRDLAGVLGAAVLGPVDRPPKEAEH